MKKVITSILVLFSYYQIQAQTGNMIFFSEEGYPFRIVMNGVIQNEKAQTNVKVPNLNVGPYKIKILFDDASLGTIDDKVYMQEFAEQTYSIKKVKISDSEKGFKAAGQNVKDFMKPKEVAEANEAKVKAQTERWSIKMLSSNPIAAANPAPRAQSQQNFTQQRPAQTQQQTVTTTTTTSQPTNSTNVNIGMNAAGIGFGMNINVNESDMDMQQNSTTTHTTQTTQTTVVQPAGAVNMNLNINGGAIGTTHTTTTQTTTTSGAPIQQVYVIPGYSGPYGCVYPMSPAEFNQAKRSIETKSFEESKFTIAKQICTSKCLLTSQVKEIMMLFTFEQTRLDFAKFAYSYTYDTGNYFQVNDAFTFETSIDDLNAFIGGR